MAGPTSARASPWGPCARSARRAATSSRYERFFGLYDRERWGHPPTPLFTLKAVVACRLVGGTATTSAETAGVDWFARDEVPELSLGRTSERLLARAFEHHDDPTLPPDVD